MSSTSRNGPIDRLLLWGLLPVFLACLALHVREVVRSGLAQLPVFVAPGPSSDPYPRVAGYRIDTPSGGSGLLPGDRLLRVGDTDLRGAGYLGFDARALAALGDDGAAPLVFERGGTEHATVIRARPHAHPWFRLPTLLGFGLVAVLVLLRAPGSRDARRFFAAFVGFAVVQAPFYGGPEWKTWASLVLWNAGGAVAAVLMLHWARRFPEELPPAARASAFWPWLGGLVYLGVRASYLAGGPLPTRHLPVIAGVTHAGLVLLTLALLVRNGRHAGPRGRRRIRWVLYGGVVGTLPLVVLQLSLLLLPGADAAYSELFPFAVAATAAAPLCVLVAIVRYDAFDVDRLIGATASWSVVVGVALLGLVTVVPLASTWAATRLDVAASTLQAILTALAVLAFVLVGLRVRPGVEALLSPEHARLARGAEGVLRDLPVCRSAEEVSALLADRIPVLLRPTTFVLYERAGAAFVPRVGATDDTPPFSARGALALALALRPVPTAPDEPGLTPALADDRAGDAEALRALGAALLVPIRIGKDLAAFLVLGAKRSGDVYTPTDRSLLAAIAGAAGAAWLRLRDDERLRRERERRRETEASRRAAEAAVRARSRLLAALGHDVRQPVHALGLLGRALRDRAGDDEARALAERVEASARALGDMLESLLDLARLDAGAVEPRVARLALAPLLERLGWEFEARAKDKGLELAIAVDPGAGAVESDPVLLGRIVANLLSNAVRYTREGRVALCAERVGDTVEIRVEDSGPGIPPERRREIFGEFVRLDAEAGDEGLGLGLAIVERLAGLLGHALEVDSAPGRGSVFALRVPHAGPAPATSRAAGEAPGFAEAIAGRLVVVVDDDPTSRAALRALLESWGCDVLAAARTEEAVAGARARRRRPDALLVDWDLGDGDDGLGAIRALRGAAGTPVPAAIVTASRDPSVVAAIRAASVPLLAKPVAPAKLRALLASLLSGAQ